MTWDLPNPKVNSDDDQSCYIIVKYLYASSLTFGALLTSYMLADLINDFYPLPQFGIKLLQIISICILTIGIWGQLRYPLHKVEVNPKAADLDDKISRTFSFCGFFFTILSYYLIPCDLA